MKYEDFYPCFQISILKFIIFYEKNRKIFLKEIVWRIYNKEA